MRLRIVKFVAWFLGVEIEDYQAEPKPPPPKVWWAVTEEQHSFMRTANSWAFLCQAERPTGFRAVRGPITRTEVDTMIALAKRENSE